MLFNLHKRILMLNLFACLEVMSLTFLYQDMGVFLSPFVLLSSGLITGLLYLNISTNKTKTEYLIPPSNNLIKGFFIVLALSVLCLCWIKLSGLINPYPIDFYKPEGSDVIPQIGVMVDRFLKGEFPYQLINEWDTGYSLFPTYLPLQWMPFILADVLSLDYRIFAFCLFVISGVIFLWKNFTSSQLWFNLFLSLLPGLFLLAFLQNDKDWSFVYTVELLIVGYYFVLASNLKNFNWKLISILIAICLLSRYSVVLFVPLFLYVVYINKGIKSLIISIGIISALVFLIYGPFLYQDYKIFTKGFDHHSKAALGAWQISNDKGPSSLIRGLGFGIYYYKFFPGDIINKLFAYRLTHFVLSILTIIVLGSWYRTNKDKIRPGIFLLGGLKLYLVIFYNFIQIPFHYLFLVSTVISLPILADLNRFISSAVHNKQEIK